MEGRNSLNGLKPGEKLLISNVLHVRESEIMELSMLKQGMTNHSFLFACNGKKYIMRIPGKGTEQLIDRIQEAAVYQVIKGRGICDNNVYISSDNGYKITEFIEEARVCDPMHKKDVTQCMEKLRRFHEMELTVAHEFNLFGQIDFYESLWPKRRSVYKDYFEVKEKVLSLKQYIDAHVDKKVLTHIDAVPDNFLFSADKEGNEKVYLIDWEYAGMQDPHIDIAMFAIYSFYSKEQIDELIQIYFQGNCLDSIRIKIYCYIAACGLLWSNWCEYKKSLGIDFGEYSLKQFRYAREYYCIICKELGKGEF